MVGAALLLAWQRDREQAFTRGLGLAFICQTAATPGYLLWVSTGTVAHHAGSALLLFAFVAYLTLLVMGSRQLSGQVVRRQQWLTLVALLLLAFASLLAVGGQAMQVLNAGLNLLVGVVICQWLWRRGAAERLAGGLLVLLGLNQFQYVFGGAERVEAQALVGVVLRMALGLTLVFAAFTRSSRRAAQLHDRFFQLTERSHQGVGVMRGEQVLYANPAVHRIYGVDSMDEHGGRWRDTTMPASERALARERHRAIIDGTLEHAQWEGERHRIDGTPIHLRFSAWRIDWDGEPAEQVVVTDATAEQNALSELLFRATHDALTGAPNRSALLQRLHALTAEGAPFALIVLDIDRFALFNEAHGPSVGDEVLVALARALQDRLGGQAEVMRLGEDEFALLVCDDDAEAGAARATGAVRSLLAQPLVLPQHGFFLDVSMGIALHPATARDPESLLRAANAAMHQAKRVPGTSQQRAESRFEHGSGRSLQAEQALRAGLEQQQFHLVFQPKVAASGHALVAFEALVRWQRDGQWIAPADFIPAAENTGLIIPLGRHILALACAQLAAWQAACGGVVPVAVNVSPLQLLEPGFPELVMRTLAQAGVSPQTLTLEITETAAVTHMEQARGQIAALREHGVEVALDDFGVGFSSLNMLRELPLQMVKIDRSLIDPMPAADARAVVKAVCDLAAALRLRVVAEGVETAEQAAAASEAGCDELQGYFFSRPLPAPEAARWLQTRRQSPSPSAPRSAPS